MPHAHFRNGSDRWATPVWLFEALDREFGFTLDVCAEPETAKCKRFFGPEENGLLKNWGSEICWMNPPYSATAKWMAKAHNAANEGATVVCLVPSKTDAIWFHRYALKHECRFVKGRLRFGGPDADKAPFASLVVVMRPDSFRLCSL